MPPVKIDVPIPVPNPEIAPLTKPTPVSLKTYYESILLQPKLISCDKTIVIAPATTPPITAPIIAVKTKNARFPSPSEYITGVMVK